MAETYDKDPYIMWLSMLTHDFPHNASSLEMKEYAMIDKDYLISLTQMNCRDHDKDWKKLAMHAWICRSRYMSAVIRKEGVWWGLDDLFE